MQRKTTPKPAAKKTYRRRFYKSSIPLSPTPMPKTMKVCIAYSAGHNMLEAALGAGDTEVYSLTGPYDPYITGAGTQPVGFDPWMTMYQNYRVVKARLEVTFINLSANTCSVMIVPNNINALPATLNAWRVDPNVSCRVLGSSSGSRAATVIDRTYVPWKILQIPKSMYMTDTEYIGSPTQNPVRQIYAIIAVQGLTAVANVDIMVRISYQIELLNPWLQAAS